MVIGTALAIVVVVLLVCGVALALVQTATGRDLQPATVWVAAAAALLGAAHLVRHRR